MRWSVAAMRTVLVQAVPVKDQGVILDPVTVFFRDLVLALFDGLVKKLFDTPALVADDVVVMTAPLQFENGLVALEVQTGDQARGLELGQHPVDGGQADFLPGIQ